MVFSSFEMSHNESQWLRMTHDDSKLFLSYTTSYWLIMTHSDSLWLILTQIITYLVYMPTSLFFYFFSTSSDIIILIWVVYICLYIFYLCTTPYWLTMTHSNSLWFILIQLTTYLVYIATTLFFLTSNYIIIPNSGCLYLFVHICIQVVYKGRPIWEPNNTLLYL